MASRLRGMLDIGGPAQLSLRVDQHGRDTGSASCRRYGIKTLVLAGSHETIGDPTGESS